MSKIMWQPTADQVPITEMDKFRCQINEKFNLQLESYEDLHNWSVTNISEFWGEMWGYGDIIYSESYKEAVDDLTKMPGAKWFSGARLNYAENLLRFRDNKIALVSERRPTSQISYLCRTLLCYSPDGSRSTGGWCRYR
jgi:acetoacetyl-CoA synthetase